MSEATPPQEWPTDWRQAVLLLLVLFTLVFHFGRSATARLTVTVGAIRLHPLAGAAGPYQGAPAPPHRGDPGRVADGHPPHLPGAGRRSHTGGAGGRYWIRTSDLTDVNRAL